MERLSIQQINKQYRNGVKALNNVTLDIGNGMFGLLGPNGAGKSSLMRTLATLQRPDNGSITFDGINIHEQSDNLRKQLGYLPQDFGVYPKISAAALLDHLAVLKGIENNAERKEQVASLLAQTNLYDVRNQAVSTFSGGMRQRFGVAQALLGNPQLIIVDEPTAGLDPQERNRFHDLLNEIGERRVVLLSTHIVEDVHDLCSQMAVLARGEVILKGEPGKLTQSLSGKTWQKKVARNCTDEYVKRHCIISTRSIAGNTLLIAWSEENPGDGFEAFEPRLEEVYFSALFGLQTIKKGAASC